MVSFHDSKPAKFDVIKNVIIQLSVFLKSVFIKFSSSYLNNLTKSLEIWSVNDLP